jgi:hypothetical protein
MSRERLASFVGNFGGKMSDIYYEPEQNQYYVHFKQILKEGLSDMGVIQFFDSEEDAELAATKYAFGEDKNGNTNV